MASNDSEIKIKVGFEPGEVPPEVFERIQEMAAEVREQFAGTSAAIAGMNGEASATCEELKAIIDLAKREGNELLAGNIENAFGSMENAEWLADMAAKEEELRGKQDALVHSTEAMMKAFQDGTVPATQMLETLEKAKEEAEQYGETLQRLKDGPAAIEKGLAAVHDVSFGQIVTQIRELADTFVQADADMEEMRYSAGETGVAIRSFFDSVKKAGNKDLLGDMVDLFGGEKMVKGLLNAEKRVEGYGKMLEWAKERAQELAAAVDGGSLSAPEALGQVEALQRMMMRVSEFAQQMPQALQQLGGMDTLERNLESLNAIPEAFEQQRQAIAAVLEPLQENTQAWRDYQAGLDATAESYAAEFAYAQKVIAQNVAMEDALQKQSAALQSNAEKAKESAKIYDGTAMSYKDAQEAMQVHTAALEAAARTTEGLNERVHAAYAQRTADADRAAQAQAKAETAAAAAAAKAAAQAEQEAYALELATKSAAELAAEIERLTAARAAAAEANDAEAYRQINTQLGAAKTQQRALKNELNLSKTAMVGQAQAAAGLASGVKGLAQQVSSGSTDIAGMATQVVQLGMEFKALSGPIGLAMLALQGAQMAFDAWMSSKQEKQKADLESMRQLAEQMDRMRQQYNELFELRHGMELDKLKKGLKDAFTDAQKVQDETLESARKKAEQDELAARKAQQAADALLAKEKVRIELAKTHGELTDAEAQKQTRAAEDAHRAELDRIAKEGEARRRMLAELAESAAGETEQKMQEALDKLKPVAAVQLPTEAELKELEHRIELLDEDEGLLEAQKEREAINRTFAEVRKLLKAAGITFEGGNADLLKFVQDIKGMVQEGEQTLESKRKERKAAGDAAAAAQGSAELAEQKRGLDAETLEAQRYAADAAKEKAETDKKAAAEAAEAQQRMHHALDELLAATQTSTSYTLEDNRHKTEILRDDMRILRERERELRALLAQADDEETRAKITDALADTLMQQRAVAAASARQAEEARKSIQAFTMPDLGVKKGLGGAGAAARRLQKLYERELERAQKALDKGDMAAYERSMKRLANSARALERVTDDPAAVKAMQEANRDALETQRNAGKTADAQRTMAQNAKRSEDAQKQLADDLSAAAQNAKQVKDRSQQLANQVMPDLQAAAPAMQQLTVQMSTLLTAANTLGNALAAFNGNMATLGNLMEQAAANATAVGNAADGAIRRVAGRVGACEKAIDRLNRKL